MGQGRVHALPSDDRTGQATAQPSRRPHPQVAVAADSRTRQSDALACGGWPGSALSRRMISGPSHRELTLTRSALARS